MCEVITEGKGRTHGPIRAPWHQGIASAQAPCLSSGPRPFVGSAVTTLIADVTIGRRLGLKNYVHYFLRRPPSCRFDFFPRASPDRVLPLHPRPCSRSAHCLRDRRGAVW